MKLIAETTRRLVDRTMQTTRFRHSCAAAASIAGVAATNAVLTASYAASEFPVPFAEGQTTFSGEAMTGFFSYMESRGTLGTFWVTQLIDFAFIAAVIAFGVFASTRLARVGGFGRGLRRFAHLSGVAVVAGATFDAIDNLWSFVMFARYGEVAQWLAVAHSSSAVAKFALEGSGFVGLALASVAGAVCWLMRRRAGFGAMSALGAR